MSALQNARIPCINVLGDLLMSMYVAQGPVCVVPAFQIQTTARGIPVVLLGGLGGCDESMQETYSWYSSSFALWELRNQIPVFCRIVVTSPDNSGNGMTLLVSDLNFSGVWVSEQMEISRPFNVLGPAIPGSWIMISSHIDTRDTRLIQSVELFKEKAFCREAQAVVVEKVPGDQDCVSFLCKS
jgi:hypothetical protein